MIRFASTPVTTVSIVKHTLNSEAVVVDTISDQGELIAMKPENTKQANRPHRHYSKQLVKQSGFTFIELMIVIAIVGIIAAIGFPSYASYVQKSRRADGHLALLNVVQSMERCKSTRFSYAGCSIPAGQATSAENFYAIAIGTGLTASTFTIQATAQNAQAGDTACATLTIDEVGGRLPADCW